jgi:hypothetical protein
MMIEEMKKFRAMLDAEHIRWEDESDDGEYPICRTHFTCRGQKWSVIHGYGTYGGYDRFTNTDKGLLEAYNFSDEPKGYLTAEEVMQYVKGADDED